MSEYQAYELIALDQPLTEQQMAELRAISKRAQISPTRFWNEYEYGDLKADLAQLVDRYFDAGLYFATWGTRRLILRLPRSPSMVVRLEPYRLERVSRRRGHVTCPPTHLLLDLVSETESAYDDEPKQALADLAMLREELLRGDARPAYLAWLLRVQENEDDDSLEPPIPAGLDDLSGSQHAMAGFLRIDADLIAAAAECSEPLPDVAAELRRWVGALAPLEKDEWLLRALREPALQLGHALARAYGNENPSLATTPRRTVRELHLLARKHRMRREEVSAALQDRRPTAAGKSRRKSQARGA